MDTEQHPRDGTHGGYGRVGRSVFLIINWCVPAVLLMITLASLAISALLILLGIEESWWMGTPAILFVLVVPLLLCGANLYTLFTTRGFTRWNNLPRRKKVIVAILIIAGVAGILFVCLVWYVLLTYSGD